MTDQQEVNNIWDYELWEKYCIDKATGDALDQLAALHGVPTREDGETCEEYRKRMIDAVASVLEENIIRE
ncbi:hypothetical protein KUA24_97 [Vibrio phage HNL01]|nr:hypothetical protein KUA24_97 [Vibrio phage HNL01]